MASGTSRALPWPKPTRPFWSPTTTSAAKPKRRPPFTTLATRLMWTSLSVNSLSCSFRSRSRSRCSRSRAITTIHLSKIQPALAGGVRQGFDAAVIEVVAAIEHHILHAGGRRAFGDPLAHRLGGADIGSGLEAGAHILFERRRRRHRRAFAIVDHLGIDVL